jgi:hypothetical protein
LIYKTNLKKQPVIQQSKSQFEVSVCLTEEMNHVNHVHPVTLADKDWTDEYKLQKLIKQQSKNQYLTNQIFGN